jgi:hypothetical protein
VSGLDLTRPEHRERLAHCCHSVLVGQMFSEQELRYMPALDRECYAALSSPEQSAAIVRALLEGCGVRLRVTTDRFFVQDEESGPFCEVWWIDVYDGSQEVAEIEPDRIPALVLRLLACTDAAGALAALREAGR